MKNYFLILSILTLFSSFESKTNYEIISESNTVELEQKKDSLIIYGIIKDNVGDSFKHAIVKVQNSERKIIVDENGKYSINVSELLNKRKELTIEFSFVGFKTEKRKIKRRLFKKNMLEINVDLKEDAIVIECPTGK